MDVTNPNSGIMWTSDAADMTRQIVEAYDKAQPVASELRPRAKPPAATPAKPPAATPAKPPAADRPSSKSARKIAKRTGLAARAYITSSVQFSRIDLTFAVNWSPSAPSIRR